MIKEMMVNKKIIVDDALECLLMPSDPAHDSLYASMQYSLMAEIGRASCRERV